MSPVQIAIGLLAVAALIVIVAIIVVANRRRGGANLPPGMRPYYSDDELETKVLERWLTWGLVLTVFFALFFPIYWLREHTRLTAAAEERFIEEVVRGEQLYQANCTECHPAAPAQGAAPSPYDPDQPWVAPNLMNFIARYEPNPNVLDPGQFLWDSIAFGRPGTPMPTWMQPDGPLTEEDIDAIHAYLLVNQVEEVEEPDEAAGVSGEELYAANCAQCHGPDLAGYLDGRPGAPLLGLFERHSEDSVMGILRAGVVVPRHTSMPPWQDGYAYEPLTDEALERIVDYLKERTEELDEDADEGTQEARREAAGS